MEERLRFAVLGPIRAWRGEDEIELGPQQQRAVLAVLLLAEGSQVLASGPVDAVWGTIAPASAPGIVGRTSTDCGRRWNPPGTPRRP
ncbi:AfsR/SARP family transcriptional regulator [Streptomyces sp. RTd22]|uniref:AfsR/SARP family transcriptional regulator n=1 Tax=Streptomyces sp. RTd22 TaxID=1841249 RepID=UPI0007C49E8E|nr:hypothetical protein [Streptomyces sp. RTd22]